MNRLYIEDTRPHHEHKNQIPDQNYAVWNQTWLGYINVDIDRLIALFRTWAAQTEQNKTGISVWMWPHQIDKVELYWTVSGENKSSYVDWGQVKLTEFDL
jgi:hypothetical protein